MGTRLFEFTGKYSLFLRNVFLLFFIFCISHSWGQQNSQGVCFGDVRSYSVDDTENFGLGTLNSEYVWRIDDPGFAGNGSISNNGTNRIQINWGTTPAGNYILRVVETTNGCSGLEKTLNITVHALPAKNLKDQYICVDPETNQRLTSALLDTHLSGSQYSFKWKLDGADYPGTTSNITVTQTGNYTVDITNLTTGCKITDSSTVRLSSAAVASVKVDNLFMDVQDIIITIEKGLGNYEYSIDNGRSYQDTPFFSVSEAGVHVIIIRDKNGCNTSYTSLRAVVTQYPKFFSPNNDGYNDVWMIDNLLPSMNAKISIFDRYGNIIKVLSRIGQSWDGDYNGAPLAADDYWFAVEYINDDGVPTVFKAHFTLKR